MSEPLRLWTFSTSPFAGKARAAFAEKGVDVELHEISPTSRPARLRDLTPIGRVPVLELTDGTAIFESSVICEWLEDAYPEPPLWPADLARRAWARAWTKWIDDHLLANYFLGMRKLAFGKAPDDPEDITERLHAKFTKRLATLQPVLAVHDGPWLCGEQFTLADLGGLPLRPASPRGRRIWSPTRTSCRTSLRGSGPCASGRASLHWTPRATRCTRRRPNRRLRAARRSPRRR